MWSCLPDMPSVIRTVAYFTDSQNFGGAEQVLLTFLAGLDRRRWRPVLIHHPAPELAVLLEEARRLDVELWPTSPMPEGLNGAARMPAFARLLRARRPAIFHAHLSWPRACKFGLFAAIAARVPAILATAHLFVEAPITRSIYLQQQLLFKGVDRYIAVSHEVARRLESAYHLPPRKTCVIPNGISLAAFDRPAQAALPADLFGAAQQPIVLTIARLHEQKGLNYLLEAAAQVPEAVFVLAGDGPERVNLEAQAWSLGLSQRVFFLGRRRDVPALLAACDVFVLPSLYEGMPLSILEAMAARKPVIATAIGGVDEVIVPGETGLLVPPRDPIALATAIRSLLSDRACAQHFAANGRARVEQYFAAEVMVRRAVEIYDELLNTSGVPRERR